MNESEKFEVMRKAIAQVYDLCPPGIMVMNGVDLGKVASRSTPDAATAREILTTMLPAVPGRLAINGVDVSALVKNTLSETA